MTAPGEIVRKVFRRFSKSTDRNTITTMRMLRTSLMRLFVFMVGIRWVGELSQIEIVFSN
jgi:hypothetical protein